MAGAVQWTVDTFWQQLQNLKSAMDAVGADLAADQLELQRLYSAARANYDPTRDVRIAPLIHNNTVLRLSYLAPVRAKFNEAVNAASAVLKKAGYTTPGLADTGMGIAPALLVPVVAVSAVVVALSAVAIVRTMTEAQRTRTKALAGIMADASLTPAQKDALAKTLKAQADAERLANPPLFDPNAFVAPLALLAAILIVPKLLPARRGAA